MDIVLELERDLDTKQISELIERLKLEEGVQKESVEWVKASDGFASLKEEYLSGVNIVENPLSDIISFNVISSQYSTSNLEKLKSKVTEWSEVQAFYYQNEETETVTSVLNKLVFGILTLCIIFSVVSVLLIINALRLRLYADRIEIKTMQTVGAKDAFIKKPYLHRSIGIGFRGALYTAIIMLCLLVIGALRYEWFAAIISWGLVFLIVVSLFVFSIALLVGISNSQLNRYLRQQMHDLL